MAFRGSFQKLVGCKDESIWITVQIQSSSDLVQQNEYTIYFPKSVFTFQAIKQLCIRRKENKTLTLEEVFNHTSKECECLQSAETQDSEF